MVKKVTIQLCRNIYSNDSMEKRNTHADTMGFAPKALPLGELSRHYAVTERAYNLSFSISHCSKLEVGIALSAPSGHLSQWERLYGLRLNNNEKSWDQFCSTQ